MADLKRSTPHRFHFEIRKEHIDLFGHVNHAKYLEIFEEARWDLISGNNYGSEAIKRHQCGPVILEATIRYKKELVERDKVVVLTYTEAHHRKIGKIYQEMHSEDLQTVHATIDLLYGLMDMRARKLIAPTKEWLDAINCTPIKS